MIQGLLAKFVHVSQLSGDLKIRSRALRLRSPEDFNKVVEAQDAEAPVLDAEFSIKICVL